MRRYYVDLCDGIVDDGAGAEVVDVVDGHCGLAVGQGYHVAYTGLAGNCG